MDFHSSYHNAAGGRTFTQCGLAVMRTTSRRYNDYTLLTSGTSRFQKNTGLHRHKSYQRGQRMKYSRLNHNFHQCIEEVRSRTRTQCENLFTKGEGDTVYANYVQSCTQFKSIVWISCKLVCIRGKQRKRTVKPQRGQQVVLKWLLRSKKHTCYLDTTSSNMPLRFTRPNHLILLLKTYSSVSQNDETY